jgi:hypothetical protein
MPGLSCSLGRVDGEHGLERERRGETPARLEHVVEHGGLERGGLLG